MGNPADKANPLFWAVVANLILTEQEDPALRHGFAELRASVRAKGGNTVPIFVYEDPDHPGKLFVADGNGRVRALQLEGIENALAIMLPGKLDEVGLIEFAATHNGVRRVLTPEEWGTMAERLIERTGCDQREAARRLNRSPSSITRYLAALTLPERHKDTAKLLVGSVRSLIAAERDNGVLDALVAYATARGPGGRLPSRDDILLHRKQLKGKGKDKSGKKPPIQVKCPHFSLVESMTIRAEADPKKWGEELKAIGSLVIANAGFGLDAVVAILKTAKPDDKSKPAA